MKEVTNLPQSLCGETQYFGDRFVVGECQYKKCINECEEGEYQFEFGGQRYNRKRYCCNDVNLCNGEFYNIVTYVYLIPCLVRWIFTQW